MIAGRFNIRSASPGAMLREQKDSGTRIGLEADQLTRVGRYVPDQLVMDLVNSWLDTQEDGFVFDGVPRTLTQAQMLDRLLVARNQSIQVVVLLDTSDAIIKQRVQRRRVCAGCKKSYGLGLHLPESQSCCPDCGKLLTVRSDDNAETLEARLREYAQKSAPLVPFYQEKAILTRIDASRNPGAVFSDLVTILEAA